MQRKANSWVLPSVVAIAVAVAVEIAIAVGRELMASGNGS